MAILAGFDVHRAQITFDALNTETGEVLRGRLRADREAVGEWAGQFAGELVEVAVEACTGWLFVYEVEFPRYCGVPSTCGESAA
jgi:transposase